jgi:hypothetical protein
MCDWIILNFSESEPSSMEWHFEIRGKNIDCAHHIQCRVLRMGL